MTYADRIRAGEVPPWVGEGADGARRSAQIVADELATLSDSEYDRTGAELDEQRQAWLDRAAALEAIE